MLKKDNWNLEVLTDQEYVKALNTTMEKDKVDFLDAMVKLK